MGSDFGFLRKGKNTLFWGFIYLVYGYRDEVVLVPFVGFMCGGSSYIEADLCNYRANNCV